MLSVSVRQFRVVCLIALLSVLLIQLPILRLISFSEGVTTARAWKYFGSTLPGWALWVYAVTSFSLVAVGLVGMLRFWRLSRWCLLAVYLIALVARPFLGLAVYSAYEAFVGSVFGCTSAWLITISFWSPLAERFKTNSGGEIVP
jgi:hypothetical protein